jgi:hypothetical protein
VINQYCKAIGRIDVELWKAVYWKGAVRGRAV